MKVFKKSFNKVYFSSKTLSKDAFLTKCKSTSINLSVVRIYLQPQHNEDDNKSYDN